MVSQLEMKEKDPQEFKLFSQVLKDIRYMPFRKFDAEFVVEDGKVLFTELTIQGKKDNEYAEELKKKTQREKKENRLEK